MGEPTLNPVVICENFSVTRSGTKVLDDLNFSIAAGQICAILGPNGSGKTTFLEAILGLIPYAGRVQVLGGSPPTNNALIGYVSQNADEFRTEFLRARDLLTIHTKSDSLENQGELFNLAVKSLTFPLTKRMSTLSTGQAQKVAIVSALAGSPSLLLLDEPLSGLDVQSANEILDLLKLLRNTQNISIFIVTHDVHRLTPILDSALIFENGTATYAKELPEQFSHSEGHHA
jgi:zinc/manganese transport system ATP-binding protein